MRKHIPNGKLEKGGLVADAWDTVAICERVHYQEILVPSVGDIYFAPSKTGRVLFLGSCDGAFRLFVNSFSDVHVTARPYACIEGKFVYTVTVKEAS